MNKEEYWQTVKIRFDQLVANFRHRYNESIDTEFLHEIRIGEIDELWSFSDFRIGFNGTEPIYDGGPLRYAYSDLIAGKRDHDNPQHLELDAYLQFKKWLEGEPTIWAKATTKCPKEIRQRNIQTQAGARTMTFHPGGTGLSGKSEQVLIRLPDGAYAAAPFSSSEYIGKIESVQNMLLARATGQETDDNLYKILREELIRDEYIKPLLPRFVTTNRSLAEFWAYIKTKFSTYRERREFIWGEFKPLLDGLEAGSLSHVSDADMQIRPLVPVSDAEQQPQLVQHEKDVDEPQRQIDIRIRSILFLAAEPTNESRLRLGEEFREIDEQLKLAKQRERFRLELPQLSLRPRDITGALLNVEPQIVHFSGHGAAKGALCFENQTGQTHLVEADTLAALFEQFAHQVDCVLLNACYSETQAKAIAKHINYVIGMSKAIGDKAAIAFALGFYQALGAGRTIEDAYKLGCVQIRLHGIPEHLTPILIKK